VRAWPPPATAISIATRQVHTLHGCARLQWMVALTLVTVLLPGFSPSGTCTLTATNGCLNGAPYDWSTQFTCGRPKADGSPGIYNYTSTSCCAQGLPYDPSKQYCCYSGVWNFDQGKCSDWDASFPLSCYCDKPTVRSTVATKTLIDTTKTPTAPACTVATSSLGCMNGWTYDYTSIFSCGNYLMDYATYGCCATATGLQPYEFGSQSCCKLSGPGHELRNGGHACDCRKYGC